MIIKHTTKTLSLLALVSFTAACSNQNLSSLPGSQLIGQQKSDDKKEEVKVTSEKVVAKPTKKPTENEADVTSKPEAPEANTSDLGPMRKTILKAPEVTTTDDQSADSSINSAFGVTTSEPTTAPVQTKAPATAQAKTTPAKPVVNTPATVATIPKPTTAAVVSTSKPASTTQNTTRRLTLSGSTTFKTGSATLSSSGKEKLASLARSLTAPNTTVSRLLIEGHTDSTGSASNNQVLSLKRANSVADYLAQQGISRSSMTTAGLGESSPIADNKTKAGRSQNRRVEITATGSRQTTR